MTYDIKRITALAGRIVEDAPFFTVRQAQDILRNYGIDPVGLTDDGFKVAYNRAAKNGHITAKNKDIIIRAYGVLKHSEAMVPEWAKAGGYSGNHEIKEKNYSDANFIKKRIWELSGHSRTPYTLWAFDGKAFHTHLTVFGSPKYLREMTKAMLVYARKSAAIFITGPSKALVLLAIGGSILEQPVVMEGKSITDPTFLAALPHMLIRIANKLKDEAPVDINYKAWFSTKTGKVIQLGASESFYEPIKRDVSQFEIVKEDDSQLMRIRNKIEGLGWVAVGVNASNRDSITAIVQASDSEKALNAARWLYHNRFEIAPWQKLNIKAGKTSMIMDGHAEILEYLKTGKSTYYVN